MLDAELLQRPTHRRGLLLPAARLRPKAVVAAPVGVERREQAVPVARRLSHRCDRRYCRQSGGRRHHCRHRPSGRPKFLFVNGLLGGFPTGVHLLRRRRYGLENIKGEPPEVVGLRFTGEPPQAHCQRV